MKQSWTLFYILGICLLMNGCMHVCKTCSQAQAISIAKRELHITNINEKDILELNATKKEYGWCVMIRVLSIYKEEYNFEIKITDDGKVVE